MRGWKDNFLCSVLHERNELARLKTEETNGSVASSEAPLSCSPDHIPRGGGDHSEVCARYVTPSTKKIRIPSRRSAASATCTFELFFFASITFFILSRRLVHPFRQNGSLPFIWQRFMNFNSK